MYRSNRFQAKATFVSCFTTEVVINGVLNFSRLVNNSMVICSQFEYVLENYSSNVFEVGNTLMQKVCKARIKMHATDELFAARFKTEDL